MPDHGLLLKNPENLRSLHIFHQTLGEQIRHYKSMLRRNADLFGFGSISIWLPFIGWRANGQVHDWQNCRNTHIVMQNMHSNMQNMHTNMQKSCWEMPKIWFKCSWLAHRLGNKLARAEAEMRFLCFSQSSPVQRVINMAQLELSVQSKTKRKKLKKKKK